MAGRRATLLLWCAAPLLAAAAPAPDTLLDAARAGETAAVEAALKAGVDANAAEPDGTRALHYAASRNDARATRLLLARGADARATTNLKVTPLLLACTNGNAEIVQLLLAARAEVNARDVASETMLMAAARAGSPAVIRLLLQAGAERDARDAEYGQTALHLAARAGNVEAVRALLTAGAELMARTRTGPEPPSRRIGGTQGKGVEKSPARGARPAIPGGKTPLHFAARDGHLEVVRALLDAGAAIDDRDPNDITPLLFAASNDRVAVAKLLIARGADIQAMDWYGRTPLYAAIDVRNRDSPEPASGSGTDVAGNLELIRLLLDKGAKPNTRIKEMPVVRSHVLPLGSLSWVDFTGETPFIRAALAGDVEVMRLLLAHGADANLKTQHGTTALAAAAGVNWTVAQTVTWGPQAQLEAVRICFEAGNDVNAANSKGIRAIHGAANRGSEQIIEFLAAHGADLTARDSEGRSALDWAQGVFLATHPPTPRPTAIAALEKLAR
jgi:ankyrin repeat protein